MLTIRPQHLPGKDTDIFNAIILMKILLISASRFELRTHLDDQRQKLFQLFLTEKITNMAVNWRVYNPTFCEMKRGKNFFVTITLVGVDICRVTIWVGGWERGGWG